MKGINAGSGPHQPANGVSHLWFRAFACAIAMFSMSLLGDTEDTRELTKGNAPTLVCGLSGSGDEDEGCERH